MFPKLLPLVRLSSYRNHTVDTLLQYYVFYPLAYKEAVLVSLVQSLVQNTMIVFVRTISNAQRSVFVELYIILT